MFFRKLFLGGCFGLLLGCLQGAASTNITLNLNDTYAGTLDVPGESHYYTFTGAPGQRLYYDGQEADSLPIYTTLLNPGGATLVTVNEDTDFGPLVLTQPGTYTLVISGTGATTGNYRFRLLDLSAAVSLTLGQILTNQLSPPLACNVHQFNGTRGQRINLQTLAYTSNQAQWQLVSPANSVLASGQIYQNLGTVTLPADGPYFLLIQGAAPGASPFGYQVLPTDVSDPSTTPTGFGVVHSGTVNGGQTNSFTVTAPAGLPVYLDSLEVSGQTLLVDLVDPFGNVVFTVAETSDAGPFVLPRSGTYTVRVRGSNGSSGNYSFQILDLSAAPALPLNTVVSNVLSAAYQTDVYRLPGTAGQTLYYDAIDADFDNVPVRLLSPDGQSPINGNSDTDRGPFALAVTGTYYLFVQTGPSAGPNYSFQLLDVGAQGALALNTDLTGTLGAYGSVMYRLVGTAGQQVYFNGKGVSGGGANWYLYDVNNVQINGAGLSGIFEQTLGYAGTYVVVLNNGGATAVSYTNQVNTFGYGTNALTLGATVSGNIVRPGDQTYYTFTGTAGQRLYFDSLNGDTNLRLYVTLVSPSRAIVFQGYSYSDLGPVTLTEAGVYTLQVDGLNNNTGPYSFQLLDVGAQGALALNTDLTGTLGAYGSVMYRLVGTAGQQVYFNGKGVSGGGANWYLYDVNNVQINGAGLSGYFEQTLGYAGTYVVVLNNAGATAVSYTNQVNTFGYGTNALTLGATVSGNIVRPGDQTYYTFTGTAGQRLYFDSLNGDTNLRLYVTLVSPSRAIVFQGYSYSDLGPVTLTEAGVYTLQVDGLNNNTGPYSFQLLDVGAQGALALNTDLTGTLGAYGSVMYRLVGTAGQQVYFNGKGVSGGGANWYLYDVNNVQINGAGLSGIFEQTLGYAGTYVVVLNNAGATAVSYTNQVNTFGYGTNALTLGATVSGNIVRPGDQTYYTFTGTAGQRLYFDSLNGDTNLRLYVTLMSPSRAIVFQGYSYSDLGPVTLTEAGVYTLQVDGLNNNTGPYSFQLLDVGAQGALALNTDLTGTLGAYGSVMYRLVGTAGQQVYFNGKGVSGGGANWYLYDVNNVQINGAGLSGIFEQTLGYAGTYVVVLNNGGATAVSYTNQVNTFGYGTNALTLGATVSGNIVRPGDQTYYTFTGTAGQRLYFDSLNGDTNLRLFVTLVSPSRAVVFQGYSYGDLGPVTLTEAGVYTLQVDGLNNNTGPYSFQLLDVALAPVATPGTDITDSLSTQTQSRWYRVNGTAGQRLDLRSVSASGNQAVWELLGPANEIVGPTRSVNQDIGAVTLPATGTYAVLVIGNGLAATPVSYQLRLTDVSDGPAVASGFGVVYSGTVNGGQTNSHAITAPAGLPVYFDSLETSGQTLVVDVIDPSGIVVFSVAETADAGPYVLPRSGTYAVNVRGSSGGSGNYSFRLLDLKASPPLPLNSVVSNPLIGAYQTDVYQLTVTAGRRLFYDAATNDVNFSSVNVQLLSPAGVAEGPNGNFQSDSSQPFTLQRSGTYYLFLKGLKNISSSYSFRLLDLAAQGAVPVNVTVTNTMTGYDAVVYQQAGTAGQSFYYDGQTGNPSGYWSLYDPNNGVVAGTGASLGADFEVVLPVTGTYALVLYTYSGAAGPNVSRVNDYGYGTNSYTLGAGVSDTITRPGQRKYYTFTGTVGQRLYYDGLTNQPTSPNTIYVQLFNPQGVVEGVTSGGFDVDRGPFTLRQSGTYTLEIDGSGAGVGLYAFRLLDLAVQGAVPLNVTVTNTMTGYDAVVYQQAGTAGQSFYYDGQAGNPSGYWSLYDPNNGVVAGTGASLGADFEVVLPVTGTYALVLYTYGGAAGPNVSRVNDYGYGTNSYTLGAGVSDTITRPGQRKYYTFTGTVGQRLYYDGLTNQPASPNTIYVQLFNPQGVVEGVTSGGFDVDRGPFTLRQSGTYTLEIDGSGAGVGLYAFRLLDLAVQGAVPVNVTVTNTMTGYDAVVYQQAGTAGQSFYYDGQAGNPSGYWSLYDPNNGVVAGTGASLGADFEVVLPVTGTYALVLYTYSGAAGPNVSRVNDYGYGTNSYTLGAGVSDTITRPGQRKYYTFTGTVGQRLYYDGLTNQPTSPNTIYVQLFNPQGVVEGVTSGGFDVDRGPFTLRQSGTYTLEIDGSGAGVGLYAFRLLDLAVQGAVPLNVTVTNTMTGYDAVVYQQAGTAGQSFYYDGQAGNPSGYWSLYDPNNGVVAGTGASLGADFEVVLPVTGTYALVLYTYGGAAGPNVSRVNPFNSDENFVVNRAPILAPIGTKSIGEEVDLTFTVSATDPDGNGLAFSLDTGAPAGATINPVSGVFRWAPPPTGYSGFTNITIRVSDNGTPGLSDAETITVAIVAGPVLISVQKSAASANVLWRSAPGKRYQLQYTTTLNDPDWIDIGPVITATALTTSEVDTTVGTDAQRYYRLLFFP